MSGAGSCDARARAPGLAASGASSFHCPAFPAQLACPQQPLPWVTSGGESYVNIEYQSQVPFDLHGVQISIPVPAGGAPQVNQLDGDWRYDARKGHLIWSIELIDASNAAGALEFVVPAADPSAFFPVEVRERDMDVCTNTPVEGEGLYEL